MRSSSSRVSSAIVPPAASRLQRKGALYVPGIHRSAEIIDSICSARRGSPLHTNELDPVQVGGIGRLEDKLPARVARAEEQHVVSMMGVEVVQNGIHSLDLGRELLLHLLQEVNPVRDGAPRKVLGERLTSRRLERPEDVALAAATIVDLLPGSLGGSLRRVHQALAGEGFGRFRSHLIHTDHDATGWWLGVEALNCPLFSAKSGSIRLPNQVSW